MPKTLARAVRVPAIEQHRWNRRDRRNSRQQRRFHYAQAPQLLDDLGHPQAQSVRPARAAEVSQRKQNHVAMPQGVDQSHARARPFAGMFAFQFAGEPLAFIGL